MSRVTLNGWPELKSGDRHLRTGRVPGTTKQVTLRDVFLPLALAVLVDINATVLPLDPGPLDGWEDREARTGAGLSDHASGTAFDFRYDVLKADHRQHLTPAQHAAMHHILAKYVTSKGKRVLGWGGDWAVGKYMDEMHLEVGQAWQPGVGSPVTAADLKNVLKRLGIKGDGTAPASHAAAVVVAKPVPVKPAGEPAWTRVLKIGSHGGDVAAVQRHLKVKVDAWFGPSTLAAVKAFQKKRPTLWPANGTVGPLTYRAITGHK